MFAIKNMNMDLFKKAMAIQEPVTFEVPKEGYNRSDLASNFGLNFEDCWIDDVKNNYVTNLLHLLRSDFFALYSVPSTETLSLLADYLKGKKVVEICAGRAYITSVLKHMNVDIVATDDYSWEYPEHLPRLTEVKKKNAFESIHSDIDFYIMSWAPYENSWDIDFLNKVREVNPNAKIVLISEGCTNSSEFKYVAEKVIDEKFEEISQSYRKDAFFSDWLSLVK